MQFLFPGRSCALPYSAGPFRPAATSAGSSYFFGSEHDVPELERQKEDSGEIEEKENTEKSGGCHERLLF